MEAIMYRLRDGTEVTRNQIAEAITAGDARIVYYHESDRTGVSLMLDGKGYDTRGECDSVWEETWTAMPDNLEAALIAAYCKA